MVGDNAEQEFTDLLIMLRETRGFDFTGYKRPTLKRRVDRRMQACGLTSISEYRDYLELEPEEFGRLFDSVLINVTGFFRDPPAWESLHELVLPDLLRTKGLRRTTRVWSAGCSTGEEAYTLAILLAEMMDPEEFTERVKIYATDLDGDALQNARAGVYTARQVADVPDELRDKYFERSGTKFSFRRDLRRQVIFGRNDLTRDAPISRVDLLVARNTLMYFTAETQASVIRKFHFALSDPGYLFLGKAEMLLSHADEFEPVDLRKRLFRKIPALDAARPAGIARPRTGGQDQPPAGALESAALDAGPVAQLVIDNEGRLAAANTRAVALFSIHPRALGRPFQDLEVSYRPVELRSVIEQVKQDQHPVELTDVTWHRAGNPELTAFDVSAIPLVGGGGEFLGIGISFSDITRYRALREELEASNHGLERAYEELQSLNEELETTNEELQSTNEELETMNEELQSTNDELQAINDILRVRSEELDAANSFNTSILRSLGNATIVLDDDLRVTQWSPGAEELWGLRREEVSGRSLLALDIGLPVPEIVPLLRAILTGDHGSRSATLDALNRRGRTIRLRVDSSPLSADDGGVTGVIMVLDGAEMTSDGARPQPDEAAGRSPRIA
ncbi:MAG TPA: CheR family methyltransferase [Streptosporangiaceae bacterium]|nr:CheR family methyltransferase [Streptosporangiaceae bacterium]